MSTMTAQPETERDREERLAIAKAREILVEEGVPAAVAFLRATAEYLRRWFDDPVDVAVGRGKHPGAWSHSNWPLDVVVLDDTVQPAGCGQEGWHTHPDEPGLFWTGVV